LNIQSQVGRNHGFELLDVGTIDGRREAKRSVDDILVESKEALGNLVCTRVLRVQRSDEGGTFAVVVELEVDGTLGENGALERI
jgi:hypothetical protein